MTEMPSAHTGDILRALQRERRLGSRATKGDD